MEAPPSLTSVFFVVAGIGFAFAAACWAVAGAAIWYAERSVKRAPGKGEVEECSTCNNFCPEGAARLGSSIVAIGVCGLSPPEPWDDHSYEQPGTDGQKWCSHWAPLRRTRRTRPAHLPAALRVVYPPIPS